MKDFELNLKAVIINYNNMLLAVNAALISDSISDFIQVKIKCGKQLMMRNWRNVLKI